MKDHYKKYDPDYVYTVDDCIELAKIAYDRANSPEVRKFVIDKLIWMHDKSDELKDFIDRRDS